MHDDSTRIEARIARFRAESLRPAIYRAVEPLGIESWTAPGEPVPFDQARGASYAPARIGEPWGAPWGTVWFHVRGEIPASWVGVDGCEPELVVDLGYTGAQSGFEAEGLVFTATGTVVKAVEPFNQSVPLDRLPGRQAGDRTVELYIEAAANPNITGDWSFTPTALGGRPADGALPSDPLYRLRRLELGLLDREVWELEQDMAVLVGLIGQLPESSQRRAEIVRALDRAVDLLDPDDVSGTAAAGREGLRTVLERPASASAHHLHAVGHAHIDSAWLWPARETARKVARTFSNVCDLIEREEGFVFAASSAQQYAWLKRDHPELFERVRGHVLAGRFVPVGGMWVESDTNMPGGEALVRQLLEGKRFFLDEFGIDTEEVWLPDSFGYSAALPQIIAGAGGRWFLTQKISWNETNTMPHHTFWWEGIDGTRVFTHFPPVDLYNSDLSGEDLARAERQYAEKGSGTMSLVPFGYGDGGGGPNREMIAAARRTRSLEGSPTVELSTPRRFFEEAQAEYPDAPTWSGELYLEFHRGTYTSQARTKQGNRRSEHLLREIELWATTALVRAGVPYPADELREMWRTVLLQQFHDILPGTSIAWVHREAEENYARIAQRIEEMIAEAVRVLAGEGSAELLVNSSPFAVGGVPALGAAPAGDSESAAVPTLSADGDAHVLDNGLVRVRIGASGLLESVVDLASGREVVPAGAAAGLLQLHRDTPNKWDAWDLDDNYRRTVEDLVGVDSVRAGTVTDPLGREVPAVVITRSFGGSTVAQTVSLQIGRAAVDLDLDIDWHERRKLLKLAFPLDLLSDRATSEIQFGHVHRPTHVNTTWDAARFETVAHRWVHVGEPGFGVAVVNDSTYGHDITRDRAAAGTPTTTVRLSLLRAPLFPDPDADQGRHRLAVSLVVGAELPDAVEAGYALNAPVRRLTGASPVAPLVSIDDPSVIVEAVKAADDGSGDVIVRLYESLGRRATATLRAAFAVRTVTRTDLMERPTEQVRIESSVEAESADVRLELRPFEIATVRLAR
ncbi:glycoside hydrolase family 38 C-terminal domain-containing protein [Rathayibacter sp. VKM Ac-2801]|uniref:alpha-mannosidase n=1 Tax=Rathayibacter sp. VKM Ac-2801 TaxID=2609255 RepID=UPI0013203A3F|nr:glycoside hydrolase family 38 C-terminal domain-containing protein [Rathayibacter sp. VKM Ac-2801]QHC69217.1 alpha-mannosidase [Rathayibacter sp. VKM Ac-2801]